MSRVKRGVTKHARHRKVIKAAKGYRGRLKKALRIAIERVEKGPFLTPDTDWPADDTERRAAEMSLPVWIADRLVAEHGEAYADYRRRTPMLFPWKR